MSITEGQGLLSPSDIADLANVSRAAVSNWRRRDKNFPEPVAGTPAKPLFDRNAVESWMTATGRTLVQDHGEAQVWAMMNTLRGELPADRTAELFLTIACVRKLSAGTSGLEATWTNIVSSAPMHQARNVIEELGRSKPGRDLIFVPGRVSSRALELVIRAVDSIHSENLGIVADFVLERLARAQVKVGAEHGFVGSRTSELLVNLAVSRTERDVIYDPACGVAIALVAAAQTGARNSRLVGCEINLSVLRAARQRAFLHDVTIEFFLGDVLSHDPTPDLRADVVIAEPPYSMRMRDPERMIDPRYEFGIPPASTADTAWIQHAVFHLSDSGRAYVLTPHGPLFRGGKEQAIRMELIHRGCVEAIVGLPPRMLPQTAIPFALWVLRRPTTSRPTDPILFIDASDEESPESMVPRWLASAEDRPEDLSAEVAITDVLAKNGMLTPNTWVSREDIDPESVIANFSEGWAQTKEAIEVLRSTERDRQPMPNLSKARSQTIDELVREGVIAMRAGRSTARYDDLADELRERVVTAGDVRDGTLGTFAELDDAVKAELPELTQAGDVLVTSMHTVRARVDESGGHLPGTGVYQLRVTNPEVISPGYLAIALTGSWNSHLMSGTTIRRAPIRELEIPLLPINEQEALVRVVMAIQHMQEQANRLGEGARQMREALLESARLGVVLDSETA